MAHAHAALATSCMALGGPAAYFGAPRHAEMAAHYRAYAEAAAHYLALAQAGATAHDIAHGQQS